MADTGVHELLSQLTGITLPERTSDAPPPNETAKQPASDTNATQAERQRQHDEKLNALLGRDCQNKRPIARANCDLDKLDKYEACCRFHGRFNGRRRFLSDRTNFVPRREDFR